MKARDKRGIPTTVLSCGQLTVNTAAPKGRFEIGFGIQKAIKCGVERGKAFFPAYVINNSSQEKIFHSYRICDNAERRSSLIVFTYSYAVFLYHQVTTCVKVGEFSYCASIEGKSSSSGAIEKVKGCLAFVDFKSNDCC
ncbi:hypothetical protein MG293_012171 [Ovis ammon polii]|uniref:Uncharacterized protein n=1 Tax=Ovis ammon polii TaxID=230172 RepID=A0AAD4U0J7_OVIAM|nr:hypothetical protein MG293_012171 [Ovis ammon polii]